MHAIWLNKKKQAKALAQKSSLDDPVEDRTVTVIKPNTVQEEDLTIWLVQNKKVNSFVQDPIVNKGFIQMDDDLVNEFAIYAQDDGDEVDASLYNQQQQQQPGENPNPSFFSQKAEEKKSQSEGGSFAQQQSTSEVKEQSKNKNADDKTPNLSELDINRAFGVLRSDDF